MTHYFFYQLFAKNSLVKNIFEEEKKFDSRALFFFLEQSSQLGVFCKGGKFLKKLWCCVGGSITR